MSEAANTVPAFDKKPAGDGASMASGLSASLASGAARTGLETFVIILVAVIIIGGAELLITWFEVVSKVTYAPAWFPLTLVDPAVTVPPLNVPTPVGVRSNWIE